MNLHFDSCRRRLLTGLLLASGSGLLSAAAADSLTMNELDAATASRMTRLPLRSLEREYPNKPDHVLNDAGDARSPREQHPAFYGCYDWHSAVHGHWMVVRLLRRFPDVPEAGTIRQVLNRTLSKENIQAEVRYLEAPNRKTFERTYGWAWLLKLAEELRAGTDPDAQRWAANLQPLADVLVERYLEFLPRQHYPIRTGVHPNTAFGLAFALDYARAAHRTDLEQLVVERARFYFGADRDYPAAWEPGGEDFFSPALLEADLMRRVLPAEEFRRWLAGFLPRLAAGGYPGLLKPALVTDRTDPKLVHLDGLNLSRAWCMFGIARALLPEDPARQALLDSAQAHLHATLPEVASGHYEGEHWLATFAIYALAAGGE